MRASSRTTAWIVLFLLLATGIAFAPRAQAGPIQISTLSLYVHDSAGLNTTLTNTSPTFTSGLDANNYGFFRWTFTNAGASPLTNLRLIVFLDADIDRDLNTFFNEYGEFVGLSIPSGALLGAIGATGWEIDEPGFLFGDILTNIQAGLLDNSNGVTSALPDDVSLALLFSIGGLNPGRMVTLTMFISPDNIDGLRHLDTDSASSFFLNGYATVDEAPSGSEIPEPASWALIALAVFFGGWMKRTPRPAH